MTQEKYQLLSFATPFLPSGCSGNKRRATGLEQVVINRIGLFFPSGEPVCEGLQKLTDFRDEVVLVKLPRPSTFPESKRSYNYDSSSLSRYLHLEIFLTGLYGDRFKPENIKATNRTCKILLSSFAGGIGRTLSVSQSLKRS